MSGETFTASLWVKGSSKRIRYLIESDPPGENDCICYPVTYQEAAAWAKWASRIARDPEGMLIVCATGWIVSCPVECLKPQAARTSSYYDMHRTAVENYDDYVRLNKKDSFRPTKSASYNVMA